MTESQSKHNTTEIEWHHEPIVVGYAFGPKKMKSMGVVMAEASRIPVIREEVEELDFTAIYRHEDACESLCEDEKPTGTLTRAALHDLESGMNTCTAHQSSTIFPLGNASDSDLKYIVRHFRSSCSSVASTSETTASTRTTTSSWNSYSSQAPSPVRISFVPLDPEIPLEEQHGGNFDMILHKLTEDILTCSLSDQKDGAAVRRIQALKRYKETINPGCCLLDDPVNVETLMSRSAIAKVLQKYLRDVRSTSGIPVRAPKCLVFESSVEQSHCQAKLLAKQLRDLGFSTPLMIKPLVAAGTKESHFMTIILKWSALSKLQPGSIIQEYINHNASLYKVYVLGKNVFVYERTSLPNLPPTDQMDIAIDSLEFDSQRPYPRLNDFGISDDMSDLESAVGQDGQSHHPCDATHVSVTVDEILPVVDTLRHAFGLELFGFDILLSQDYKEFHVVDVNYFPSYKEVPNFPMLLAQYLTQRVLEQRRVRRLRISSKS